MARTSNAHVLWRRRLATWVYDYAALAEVADRIRIMAYDDHAPDTAAGPIAPYGWVEQVIAYARAELPTSKAELGIAAFGYTWSGGSKPAASGLPETDDPQPNSGDTFAAAQAGALAASHHTTPEWSASAAEERFSYGTGREATTAWYEDARAEVLRARLAIDAGFAGVVLWAAGDETPSFWTGVADL
jgi:spore germination protein YaaH